MRQEIQSIYLIIPIPKLNQQKQPKNHQEIIKMIKLMMESMKSNKEITQTPHQPMTWNKWILRINLIH